MSDPQGRNEGGGTKCKSWIERGAGRRSEKANLKIS